MVKKYYIDGKVFIPCDEFIWDRLTEFRREITPAGTLLGEESAVLQLEKAIKKLINN